MNEHLEAIVNHLLEHPENLDLLSPSYKHKQRILEAQENVEKLLNSVIEFLSYQKKVITDCNSDFMFLLRNDLDFIDSRCLNLGIEYDYISQLGETIAFRKLKQSY